MGFFLHYINNEKWNGQVSFNNNSINRSLERHVSQINLYSSRKVVNNSVSGPRNGYTSHGDRLTERYRAVSEFDLDILINGFTDYVITTVPGCWSGRTNCSVDDGWVSSDVAGLRHVPRTQRPLAQEKGRLADKKRTEIIETGFWWMGPKAQKKAGKHKSVLEIWKYFLFQCL